MESMGSFLANLSGTSREHDEQVRTWMNQVRILANDCNNCIDLYLYRGDPALHLPKEGPGRYLRWAPWLLRKLLAQHRAAGQLRELKDRAQDIGNRRMRYGVEVKTESSSSGAGLTESLLLSATQDHEEEEEDDDDQHGDDPLKVALSMTTMWMDKEDYFRRRLDDWIGSVVQAAAEAEAAKKGIKLNAEAATGSKPLLPSIAFVAKNEYADHLRCKVLEVADGHFKRAKGVQDKVVPPTTKDAGNIIVFVDIRAVHYHNVPLRPHKILCYILAELEPQQGKASTYRKRWGTYKYARKTIHEIKVKINKVNVDGKINDIVVSNLGDSKDQLWDLQILDNLQEKQEIGGEELGRLLRLLIYHSTSTAAATEKDKKIKSGVSELYDDIIKQTARNLKLKIEEGCSSSELQEPKSGGSSPELQELEYEDILKTVFPETNASSITTTTAANSPHSTLVDDQIQEMVRRVTEMMHDLRELEKSDKTTPEADFHESIVKKKAEIIKKIRKQLKVKMMMQKIKKRLEGDQRILVILEVYDKHVPVWQETRNSLISLELECPIAGAVFVVTKTTQQDFSCPDLMDRIEYSLVGLYLDTVVHHTGQHMNDPQTRLILRNILRECEPHEFCMKIFAQALYTKPKRSREELSKLHSSLCARDTPESLPSMMLKFSYRELPKDYRSCLLYLAIFPQGEPIRRSTLIERWVAEGLITTKDWSWSSSVVEAEKCFDTLVARCLVCPSDIGATGKVKSCTVHKLVYGFITKIAKKQRILQTRLSRHLAHHFSIFSDVRLRSSETIEDFLKKSSQFSKLKVLDLEGCRCFQQKNQCYLRDICRKILMLKYLSLRRTDVTSLPSEINNLHELEVLDIRDTNIPAYETRTVLLRKLKRLLAGQKLKLVLAGEVDPSPSSPTDFPSVQMPEKIEKKESLEVPCNVKLKNRLKRLLPGHVDSSPADFSSVQIPEKVEKMEGVEVLSNVKPKSHQDLKDIGGLNELKKLGVVINKESDLQRLLKSINDLLKQSLRFLSITLDISIYKGSSSELSLVNSPKYLESLTINGSKKCPKDLQSPSINKSTSTHMGKILELLTNNGNKLAKVTLSCTFLSQEHLNVLAKLENLRCVKLRHNAYTKSNLIFKEGEFKNLNRFLVEGTNMTEIIFDNGAATQLEKIVLSSTNIVPISGVNYLQNLEELELNHIKNKGKLHSLLHNADHITKVTLRDTLLEQSDLEILAQKPNMRCIVLLDKTGSQLILNKDEFQNVNLPIVDKLPTSKELNGGIVPDKVKEDIKTPEDQRFLRYLSIFTVASAVLKPSMVLSCSTPEFQLRRVRAFGTAPPTPGGELRSGENPNTPLVRKNSLKLFIEISLAAAVSTHSEFIFEPRLAFDQTPDLVRMSPRPTPDRTVSIAMDPCLHLQCVDIVLYKLSWPNGGQTQAPAMCRTPGERDQIQLEAEESVLAFFSRTVLSFVSARLTLFLSVFIHGE
uniref:Disease resistance RPP13-like protein 4 n=1 Tax=Aegilops tauschii TaxID=37682 RepID=M8CBX3_AEGTA